MQDPTPEAAKALLDRLPSLLPDDPAMAAILAEALIRGKVREPMGTGNKINIDYGRYQIHLAKSLERKGKPTSDKVTYVITGFETDKEDA